MEALKFKVDTPEESTAIQEMLFLCGCSWSFGYTFPKYTSAKHLYVCGNGYMSFGDGDTQVSKEHFNKQPHRLFGAPY